MAPFRFETGQRVRVVTHPAQPVGTVVARWTAEEVQDVHGENVYAVSVFVTKQRESSLAPAPDEEPTRAAPGAGGSGRNADRPDCGQQPDRARLS
jgi:hypothetical protein